MMNRHLTKQRVTTRHYWGMDHLHRIHGAICPDGSQRTATVTGPADTAWTIPARVTAHGRTVTGHLHRPGDGERWVFTPDRWRKNAHILSRGGRTDRPYAGIVASYDRAEAGV